jgi:ubiquinone/menaquinone biosynthesis C-methylase UbiE
MEVSDYQKAPGHWILAKMGKKILRPGGLELTTKMIEALDINVQDEVVEFAPGLGYTAMMTCGKNPKTYVGIDADNEVVARLTDKIGVKNKISFVESTAEETSLSSDSKDKIYGEAMLTMHADQRKERIIREAHRVLKKGGLYAIHEMGLSPDTLSEEVKAQIQRDLATSIRVNARPLTTEEWKKLLEKEGFKIKSVATNGMHLLKVSRMIADEGFLRTLKIGGKILFNSGARKRILEMRKAFLKYENHLNSVMIVAEKV